MQRGWASSGKTARKRSQRSKVYCPTTHRLCRSLRRGDKVRDVGSKILLWASGERDTSDAKWYDFTGAPIPSAELQFGIGQDKIRSIDDPLFVSPDDPRLLDLPASRYRPDEQPESNDEIMVIGFARGDDARAYPAALLDRHELVNDHVDGMPVTIGW